MNQRTIDSLRRLAERPGTEHEGIVAREMLRKFEGKTSSLRDEDYETAYRRFARKEISIEEFIESMRNRHWPLDIPTHWVCACGTTCRVTEKCGSHEAHADIQEQIRKRFKRGDRVYYNYHCYKLNCPGIVAAHIKPKRENGNYHWSWLSVRFDHLKSARQCPIYSAKGWHLTHDPLPTEEAERMAHYA